MQGIKNLLIMKTAHHALPTGFEQLNEEQQNRLFYVEDLEKRLELSSVGTPDGGQTNLYNVNGTCAPEKA